MKISVICPTYNSSLHIKRAMNSLLDQTEIPYEVIFSDDGSTDDTITIINNYKEYKFLQKNKNKCLKYIYLKCYYPQIGYNINKKQENLIKKYTIK